MCPLFESIVGANLCVARCAQDTSNPSGLMAVVNVDAAVAGSPDGEIEFLSTLRHGAEPSLRLEHLADLFARQTVRGAPLRVALGFLDFGIGTVARFALPHLIGVFGVPARTALPHLFGVLSAVARVALLLSPLLFFLCQALARHYSQLLMPVVGSYLHAPPSASSAGFSLRMPLRIPAARNVVQPLAPPS